MNNYERGSEWRKWDLHIHSPGSFHWNGGKRLTHMTNTEIKEELKAFIKVVNDSDVAVFCLMDYWNFDWYFELKKYLKSNPSDLKKTVFPGIELRVECPVNYRLNIHCILSDSLSEQEIADFKSELYIRSIDKKLSNDSLMRYAKSLDASKSRIHGFGDPATLEDEQLLLLAAQTAEITKDSLNKAFEQIPNNSGFILLPYDTSDGLLNLDWKEHPHDDNYFMQSAHIFETRDQRNIDLISGIETPENNSFFKYFFKTLGEKAKPCVSGSDAHKYTDYGKYPSNKITWMKADPTFEGLKQIIFEPKDRVRIQETNPTKDFEKPYFNSISVNGQAIIGGVPSFQTKLLPLNPGLVALIGGRGTGKSILLDCVYKLFNNVVGDKDRLADIAPESLEIVFSKSDGTEINYTYEKRYNAELDYLHVRQGEIKEIAKKPEALSDAIKKLLGIDISSRAPDYDQEISVIIDRIEKSLAWFELKNEDGQLINDRKHNDDVIKSNRALINTITTDQNRENIEKYQKNQKGINTRNSAISRLTDFKTSLASHRLEINRDIDELNKFQLEIEQIPTVDFTEIESLAVKNIEKLKSDILNFNTVNGKIEASFKEQGINQDVSGLLKKIAQYQREIDEADEKITEYNDKIESINIDVNERIQLVDKIVTHLNSEIEGIDNAFKKISEGKEGWSEEQNDILEKLLANITIKGEIHFNPDEFYEGLTEILNGSKFRATGTETQDSRIRCKFNVSTYEDYIRLLKNEKIIRNGDDFISINEFYEQKEYFLKGLYNIYQYLYLFSYRKNYLNIKPVITYMNKSPDKLSVGQRGTFYVCMKLATDPFGSPFVFDQPEDDLDNDFIMKELVPIFRSIKKYRQVIIATHNANLVVNADAEQVIVANNTDEVLSYDSGSIENTSTIEPLGIRERVCNILEGGDRAFKQREMRYAIKQ